MSQNLRGTLYHRLKTHKAVDEFCLELYAAHHRPSTKEDRILSSMWKWLDSGKQLSFKQIDLTQRLIWEKYNPDN